MPPKTQRKPAPPSPLKNIYLLAYNALNAALWAGVLYKTLTIGTAEVIRASKSGWLSSGEDAIGALQKGLGSGKVYDELEKYTRLTQTLAGLEVLHSIFGTFVSYSIFPTSILPPTLNSQPYIHLPAPILTLIQASYAPRCSQPSCKSLRAFSSSISSPPRSHLQHAPPPPTLPCYSRGA
jgi:hypothetical protein